jgi:S1-C subfamily serine protease
LTIVMRMNNELSTLSAQMADAVDHAARSLVTVNGRERQSATGIVYAADHVLTADHVLERDDNLTVVTPDGRTLPAQLLGRDSASDLSVLRVVGLNLPAAVAAATTRLGQLALAVGRPSADGAQASAGIVSQIGGPLKLGRGAQLERFIRTDAIPYPGFSGGALVDATGALYGMLTTGLARGVALIIPMDLALRIAGTISSHGYVKRGYLGVVTQQVAVTGAQQTALAREAVLLVVKVEDGSPAAHAGMLVGDLIDSLDGVTVGDADTLLGLLNGERVGKAIAVHVLRGGARTALSVTLGQKAS